MSGATAGRAERGRLRSWLVLLRAGNLPTVATNAVVGLLLGGGAAGWGSWVVAVAALWAVYLGGMVLNDLWDRAWDARHRPERPLVAGRVSPGSAWAVAVALPVVALAALAATPGGWAALAAGGALVAMVVAYDRWHKRNPAAPLLMGACRALCYPVAGLAGGGRLTLALGLAAALQLGYVGAVTWVSARRRPAPAATPERITARALTTPPRRRPSPIPWLLAGISAVDGALLAVFGWPGFGLVLGLAGVAATRLGQRWAPGD